MPVASTSSRRRGAIDDEAEVAPLGDALVLAERQRHARVEVAVGGLVERGVERAEGDVADRLPAGTQPADGARHAQRPTVDGADHGEGQDERPEDLCAGKRTAASAGEMFAL